MFERYTESARRVIFFARYEASNYGSHIIQTEHLLLGLLREDYGLKKWFPDYANLEEGIRADIEKQAISYFDRGRLQVSKGFGSFLPSIPWSSYR
jgi:ATP-dependent Clp protease ATP-binding subunit ClpA